MFDYSKLFGRMAEKKYSQRALAQALNISENAFTNKVKGRSTFNSVEIATICNILDISNTQIGAYFFNPAV